MAKTTFETIVDSTAAAHNKIQEIVAIIKNRMSDTVNPNGLECPIDYSIIAHGSPDEIRELASEYDPTRFRTLMLEPTCRGNNPLHLAAKFNTPEAIATILTLMGEEGSALAVRSNAEGIPPGAYLIKNPNLQTESEFHKAAAAIVPITRNAPTLAFSALIDINQLTTERYPQVNDSQIKNLELAAQCVNETRGLIEHSSTHILVNLQGSSGEFKHLKEVRDRVKDMRKAVAKSLLSSSREVSAVAAEYAINYKVGNCAELADIMYEKLKNKSCTSSNEIFSLANGDHDFNVIARTPGSNPNDPTTWGDNCIIADAWSGEVYLASEIPSKLKGVRAIDYQGDIHYYLEPYNARFHKLVVIQATYPEKSESLISSNSSSQSSSTGANKNAEAKGAATSGTIPKSATLSESVAPGSALVAKEPGKISQFLGSMSNTIKRTVQKTGETIWAATTAVFDGLSSLLATGDEGNSSSDTGKSCISAGTHTTSEQAFEATDTVPSLATNSLKEPVIDYPTTVNDPFSDSPPIRPVLAAQAHVEAARFLESFSERIKTMVSVELTQRSTPHSVIEGNNIGYSAYWSPH